MENLLPILTSAAQRLLESTAISDPAATIHTVDFSLSDPQACNDCKANRRKAGMSTKCTEEVMKVHISYPVGVVGLDGWIKTFPNSARSGFKNCDYILADAVNCMATRKVAFCDLTCSSQTYLDPNPTAKHPEGKRKYMLSQMQSFAAWMMADILAFLNLSTATDRRLVFGIRRRDMSTPTQAAQSMAGFTTTPSSQSGTLTSDQIISGVHFRTVEVTYPSPLIW